MPMRYMVEDSEYLFSYREMQESYLEFSALGDEEFISRLPEILHFVVFAAWVKEIPTSQCLSDKGIIHELTHLLSGTEGCDIVRVRNMFNKQMSFV